MADNFQHPVFFSLSANSNMPSTRLHSAARPLNADPQTHKRPVVSVILPVFNGEVFIQAAIESVFAQTFKNFELIVVDDGSTDATMAILECYGDRLEIIRQQNAGHASARNAAARKANGIWIAMIDADDVWHPEKLQQQLDLTTLADVVYTGAHNFEDAVRVDDATFLNGQCPSGDVFDHLMLDNFITHSSILMRRDKFFAAGGYDETLRTTCDWDLWLRMSASGCQFHGIAAPLTHYRWRNNSNSRNHARTCSDRLQVLQRALQHPRATKTPVLLRQKAMARVWQTSAWFVAENDDRQALRWYLRSVCYRPYSIRGWKEVTRCCLHLCGISRKRLHSLLSH
jgi:glycosyltransferase involved in cell wall biosynthesis